MSISPLRQRLLITGSSGFLGWHLYQVARAQGGLNREQIFGTHHTRAPHPPTWQSTAIDLTDFTALKALFETIQPTAVIHTAAQSKPNLCQTDPIASHAINVTASLNLAGLCADANIPLVFTSTDLVFDGHAAPYREDDPVHPLSLYGEQKVLAEEGILERHPAAAICRMPLMFGVAPTASSFLQDFFQMCDRRQVLKLFVDEFRTPVNGFDAAKGLLLALETGFQGRLHLGGKERLSRYEFGRVITEVFGLDQSLIQPAHQADVPMPAPRPPDVSMDSSRAFALGYAPQGVRQGLEEVKERG